MKQKAIDRDALNCARLGNGTKLYSFVIREDGVVLKTRRTDLRETKAKITIADGKAWVYIGRIKYKLDSLVAKHFIPGYKGNDVIEHINGKIKDCAVWNIRIIPRSEYNKGRSRNGLCKPVIVNGVEYPSVQACASALYVEQSTLHNFLKGKYKKTMLDGMDIHPVTDKEAAINEP